MRPYWTFTSVALLLDFSKDQITDFYFRPNKHLQTQLFFFFIAVSFLQYQFDSLLSPNWLLLNWRTAIIMLSLDKINLVSFIRWVFWWHTKFALLQMHTNCSGNRTIIQCLANSSVAHISWNISDSTMMIEWKFKKKTLTHTQRRQYTIQLNPSLSLYRSVDTNDEQFVSQLLSRTKAYVNNVSCMMRLPDNGNTITFLHAFKWMDVFVVDISWFFFLLIRWRYMIHHRWHSWLVCISEINLFLRKFWIHSV